MRDSQLLDDVELAEASVSLMHAERAEYDQFGLHGEAAQTAKKMTDSAAESALAPGLHYVPAGAERADVLDDREPDRKHVLVGTSNGNC